MKKKGYKLSDGVVFRDYGDFGLVVNIPLRKNITLNSSASKVLTLIKEGGFLKDLKTKIKSKKITSLNNLSQILDQLEKQKIIKTF